MSVNPIPVGFHTVTPYLLTDDADRLLGFLQKAFNASIQEKVLGPEGRTAHAAVLIGNSMVMLGSKPGTTSNHSMLYLYVDDTDAMYQQALSAGAKSIQEPKNQFYGDRNAAVEDCCGHQWWIGTHVEDVSPEELERRAKEMKHACT